jgi:Fic family protein
MLRKQLAQWHLALFSSSVAAGIVTAVDLAGYRNRPVFIAGALHVPPPHEALRDCMPLLMELLEGEESGAVRAVLGHFAFVFIHPYIDGNGRLGRFIMNYMLTTAGFVWTIVPVQQSDEYMAALQQASTYRNVRPFAQMLARLVGEQTATPLARESQRP